MQYKLLLFLFLLSGYAASAQPGGKQGVAIDGKTYFSPDTALLRGEIAEQRTAMSVGIPKILSMIPSKNYPVILENYASDKESLNLKTDIRNYLAGKGYTNIKTNVHPLYGEDFKFRNCDVAIMNIAETVVLFLPPCPKAYKK